MPLDPNDLENEEEEEVLLENEEEIDEIETEDEEDDDSQSAKGSGNQLSPEQIAHIAAQAAAGVNRQQQQPVQMSPEELDAKLQRFKVTEDHVTKILDPEVPVTDRMKMLQEMLDGAARHAVTSSQVLMQGALSPIQQAQAEYAAVVREQKLNLLAKHVETKFPALAGKKVVVKKAVDALLANGYQPPGGSKSALQKEVAKTAAAMIRQIDPSFSLKANPQRQAGSFGSRRQGGSSAPTQASSGARTFMDLL